MKLARSNDGFRLSDIDEVRCFFSQISTYNSIPEEAWKEAKRQLLRAYPAGQGLDAATAMIDAFETANPTRRYSADFNIFARESRLEDFAGKRMGSETIFVSTMHKAKGCEFDNVFLCAARLNARAAFSAEELRLLYVAITRARKRLSILDNCGAFDGICEENLIRREDHAEYGDLPEMPVFLTHKDLNLGFFENARNRVDGLRSGMELRHAADGCETPDGKLAAQYSVRFQNKIAELAKRGLRPESARVSFVLWWRDKKRDIDTKIILPEITFIRADS